MFYKILLYWDLIYKVILHSFFFFFFFIYCCAACGVFQPGVALWGHSSEIRTPSPNYWTAREVPLGLSF